MAQPENNGYELGVEIPPTGSSAIFDPPAPFSIFKAGKYRVS